MKKQPNYWGDFWADVWPWLVLAVIVGAFIAVAVLTGRW